jgi:hypothetical protein
MPLPCCIGWGLGGDVLVFVRENGEPLDSDALSYRTGWMLAPVHVATGSLVNAIFGRRK